MITAHTLLAAAVSLILSGGVAIAGAALPEDFLSSRSAAIPANFPRFTIPGHTTASLALRDLFWHHSSSLGPVATLWDEWLLPPTVWPAYRASRAGAAWRKALEGRHLDPDGYVATHQHGSIAHQRGWPFPAWHQAPGNFGWHFSFADTITPPWRPDHLAQPADWQTTGIESAGIKETGWEFTLAAPRAAVAPPAIHNPAHDAPFLQIRWRADDISTTLTPYVEWTTTATPGFTPGARMYFDPPEPGKMAYTMVPVYRHPLWAGHTITGLRLGFDNPTTGTRVILQAMFAQYDTRHDVNNPSFVSACVDYFHWTRDLNFLRANMERMRLAMRFMETEFGTDKDGIVTVPWVGHEGTSGVGRTADGKAIQRGGRGVGNNYWDLVPFGQKDSYATIRHYGAALKMAALEQEIADNPAWNIPTSPLARSADHWRAQAAKGREAGNRLFWNDETGRFTLGIDAEGKQADYGYTFVNLEAIAYGFATDEHARAIMDWISGRRDVATDTARTTDIYHWRFAPRATTLRNTDHYGWFWSGAASIPFGDQVQDGGAVMGFSYHDIQARLRVLGPDDAARRLEEICAWYSEVISEGGYRAYYDGKKRPGNLQGGNVAGGLGMDKEFFESVLVPQVMVDGFLGLSPTGTGVALNPALPESWPSLTVDNISVHGVTFSVKVTSRTLTLERVLAPGSDPQDVESLQPLKVQVGKGWKSAGQAASGQEGARSDSAQQVQWTAPKLEFTR